MDTTLFDFMQIHQSVSFTTCSESTRELFGCGSMALISLIGIIGAKRTKSRNNVVKMPSVPMNSI